MEEIASLSQLQKSILETSKLLENRHPLHKCVLCTQIEKLQDNYYTFREERTWGRWLPRAIISIPSMDLHLIRQTKNKLQGRPKKKSTYAIQYFRLMCDSSLLLLCQQTI